MNRLFSQESPMMRFLNGLADLAAVNLLMILFSLPVVTLGAAVTAGCRVTRDIADDTVIKIFPSFWKAFRENFKQATLFWVCQLVVLAGLGYNFYLFQFLLDESHYKWMLVLLIAAMVAAVGIGVYGYMLISRYSNRLSSHLKNATLLFLNYFPLSVLLAGLNAIPAVLFVFSPRIFLETFVVWACFGFALILLLDNLMLKRIFSILENPPEN